MLNNFLISTYQWVCKDTTVHILEKIGITDIQEMICTFGNCSDVALGNCLARLPGKKIVISQIFRTLVQSPFYPFQTNNVRNQSSCIPWESLVFNQPPAWGCTPTLGTHIPPGVRHSGSAGQEQPRQVLLLLLCHERAETCSGWECGMGKWASLLPPSLLRNAKIHGISPFVIQTSVIFPSLPW